MSGWTGSGADVVWHHWVEIDPDDLLKQRRLMKMALARYAKQPLLQWGDTPVREIKVWYNTLVELMSHEGTSTTVED